MIALKVFAVAVCFLLVSASAAYATNINVVYGGSVSYVRQLDAESLVSKQVSLDKDEPFYSDIRVGVSVANAGAAQLEKVYIYKCKGMLPVDCISSVVPEVSQGNVQKSYGWSSIASTPYPQVANILYVAKLNSQAGEDVWVGFWDQVRRTSPGSFDAPPYGKSLAEVNVEASSAGVTPLIDSFIEANSMLPSSLSWVVKSAFPGASRLHVLKASKGDIDVPALQGEIVPGQDAYTPLEKDFYLVFPETASGINNPITLVDNPSYICGNGNVETGETSSSCCYDAGCVQGLYCDTVANACRLEGEIRLTLSGQQSTAVSNCNVQNSINVTAKIENPPGGVSIAGALARLGGAETTAACTGGQQANFVYACRVTVPATPGCSSGTYSVGPNELELSIQYNNGPGTATKALRVAFPDITVGSYAFGNGICESGLGEGTDASGCYDCGCAAGYCDAVLPGPGTCRPLLTSNNLAIGPVVPANFPAHSAAGDAVSFQMNITEKPASLVVGSPACTAECGPSAGACTASCSLSCAQRPSAGSVYSSDCRLGFIVNNYDNRLSYTIKPSVSVPVSYNDGVRGPVTATLSKQAGFITIGTNFCGDGIAGPGEECCYDSGCQAGQYCDVGAAPESGLCKPEGGIAAIAMASPLSFIDTSVAHTVNASVRIANMPAGASVVPGCRLSNETCGQGGFIISCSELGGSQNEYLASCEMTIPAINYKTSPHFDAASRAVRFSPNELAFSLRFNDGPAIRTKEIAASIPEISITPVPRCGNGVAEPELGETQTNCCVDLGCAAGQFCYNANNPNGVCLAASSIAIVLDKVEPEDIRCTIVEKGSNCVHDRVVWLSLHVNSPPSDGRIGGDVFYRFDGRDIKDIVCLAEPGGQNVNYMCTLALPDLESREGNVTLQAGKTVKQLSVFMPYSYSSGGQRYVQNFSLTTNITIRKVKSEALKALDGQIRDLDQKIGTAKKWRSIILAILIAGAGWCTCNCVPTCAPEAPPGCPKCWLLYACVVGATLPILSQQLQQLDQIKAEKESLKSAQNSGDFTAHNNANRDIALGFIAIAATLVCTIGTAAMGSAATNVGTQSGAGAAAGGGIFGFPPAI
ncbi:MAG: hypothetical protein HY367_00120 [Candidatus Aenigmarchaeota archaeon]|nr:hypothetical protein [Candidatus Aenigmarchaeota archaeon]